MQNYYIIILQVMNYWRWNSLGTWLHSSELSLCTELHLSIRVQLDSEIMNAKVEDDSHLLPLDTNVQWTVFYEECGDNFTNSQNKPLGHNCYQS